MKERNGQLRYLSIVIGAFLSVGVIVGLTNNLYSLYVIPITTGLGISRGLYSMGITVRYIASAFCNLFMGRLYQRFGYRRPTVLLVLLVAASYVGYGTARNAVPLFLGALIYGVGEYFISTAALSRMLGNWFQSHLGVVTGIVMAASGVGGSALSLVLSGIMESAGWRTSLLFAAGLLAAVAVMIFFVMKDRPEELGLQPYHDPERRGAAHKPKKVAAPWAIFSFSMSPLVSFPGVVLFPLQAARLKTRTSARTNARIFFILQSSFSCFIGNRAMRGKVLPIFIMIRNY